MDEPPRHLVFYDGSCGLCDHTVQFLLKADKQRKFLFAPLQGETAKTILRNLPPDQKKEDSLILVENFNQPDQQIYLLGKGALRISWLLGGPWRLFGWMSFLPSFLFDALYRILARNRHRFFGSEVCVVPDASNRDRFLP